MNMGTERRLGRLRGSGDGPMRFLAMDHGMSQGGVAGMETPRGMTELIRDVSADVDAVVLTLGMVDRVVLPPDTSLVVQLFGMPLCGATGRDHVRLRRPREAVRVGADAVAVQTSFTADALALNARDLAATIGEAHDLGLPVLFMVSNHASSDPRELLNCIRVCVELGADIVKIAGGQALAKVPAGTITEAGVPVLLPGGGSFVGLQGEIAAAARAGYSGVCFGRPIFQSAPAERRALWLHVSEAWVTTLNGDEISRWHSTTDRKENHE